MSAEKDAARKCPRCGWKDGHADWCHQLGFDSRDPQLCPGDGCPGCFHCTSTEGDIDGDRATEPGRDVEQGRAVAVAWMEGATGEPTSSSRTPAAAEPVGEMGRTPPGPVTASSAEKDALYRLFDQAYNTAGDDAGRQRATADYVTVFDALDARVLPTVKGAS